MITSPLLATVVDKVSATATPAGLPMVRLEKLMAVPAASILAVMTMLTESFLPGTPEGLQLVAVFQRLLVAPVQVLGEFKVCVAKTAL